MKIDLQFRLEYLSFQYDYFENLGYSFFYNKSSGELKLVLSKDEKELISLFSITKYSKEDYLRYNLHQLSHSELYQSGLKDEENIHLYKFMIDFFHHFPQYREQLLTYYFSSFTQYQKNAELTFLNDIHTDKNNPNTLLNFIHSFGKGWSIIQVPLNDLDSYLRENGVAEQDIDQFFYDFIYQRQQELEVADFVPHIKHFLMTKYDNNIALLQKYFHIFPALKNEFSNIIPDFFIKEEPFHSIVQIDFSTICSLYIDFYGKDEYTNCLHVFNQLISEIYSVRCDIFEKKNYSHEKIVLVFHHYSEQLNSDFFEQLNLRFLLFIKENPSYDIIKENICSWLNQDKLNQELLCKQEVGKKLKI